MGSALAVSGEELFFHNPALLDETVRLVRPQPGGRVVDGTVGAGGHARALASRLGGDGLLIGIDLDPRSLAVARETLADLGDRVRLVHGSFAELETILDEQSAPRVDAVLLDLGLCSLQVDRPEYGFSFLHDGPLDLRFDVGRGEPAWRLIERLDARSLASLLRRYGEEPSARKIAEAIVHARREAPVRTTGRLASVVEQVVPRRGPRHPATRVFQALRVVVNDEIGALIAGLRAAARRLVVGGRLVVISYHSLEDRPVKRFFGSMERPCVCPREAPVCVCGRAPAFRRLTRKPIRAGEDELAMNPRARSAKLRAGEKIGEPTEAMVHDAAHDEETAKH